MHKAYTAAQLKTKIYQNCKCHVIEHYYLNINIVFMYRVPILTSLQH